MQEGKYRWQKKVHVTTCSQDLEVHAHVTFSTKDDRWVGTFSPVILPLVLDSPFHENPYAVFKFQALISVVRKYVQGKVTVLIADKAHWNISRLKSEDPSQRRDEILQKYLPILAGYQMVMWDELIVANRDYESRKEQIEQLYETDLKFREFVQIDAELSYNPARREEFLEKSIYLRGAIQDILQQCVCLLICIKEGYAYEFMPEKAGLACRYLTEQLLHKAHSIGQIYVSLHVDKCQIKQL